MQSKTYFFFEFSHQIILDQFPNIQYFCSLVNSCMLTFTLGKGVAILGVLSSISLNYFRGTCAYFIDHISHEANLLVGKSDPN